MTECAPAIHIQSLIDHFVRHSHFPIQREIDAQPASNLLRRELVVHPGKHLVTQERVIKLLGCGAHASPSPTSFCVSEASRRIHSPTWILILLCLSTSTFMHRGRGLLQAHLTRSATLRVPPTPHCPPASMFGTSTYGMCARNCDLRIDRGPKYRRWSPNAVCAAAPDHPPSNALPSPCATKEPLTPTPLQRG